MTHTRFIKRILVPLVLLAIIVYAGDYLRLQVLPDQFGSVQVKRMYEVKLKNRKTEYLTDDPQAVPCVNSAFPQMGYAPCWYLSRHRVQTVEIDAGRAQPIINTP
jgi:hypothetical protein